MAKEDAALRALVEDGEKVQQFFGYDRADPANPKLKPGYETPLEAVRTDYKLNADLLRSIGDGFLPLTRWVDDYVRHDPIVSKYYEDEKKAIRKRINDGDVSDQTGDMEKHSLVSRIIDQHLTKAGAISASLYFNVLNLIRDYHKIRTSTKTDDPHNAFLDRISEELGSKNFDPERPDIEDLDPKLKQKRREQEKIISEENRKKNLDTIVTCLDRGFVDNQAAATLQPFYGPLAKVIRTELKDMCEYALQAKLRLEGHKNKIDAAYKEHEKDIATRNAEGLRTIYDAYRAIGVVNPQLESGFKKTSW